MKRLYIFLIIFLFSISINAQVDRSQPPKPGPAPEIKIGTVETFELKNGLKVIVVENHKLPRVSFSISLNFEAIQEKDRAGYASIAGELLRAGTETRSKAEIDESIDFLGATISTSASGVYASSLTKHKDQLLGILTDILYNPSFPVEEFEKIKTQTLSALADRKETPEAIASNVRSVVLFGKDHPYGELTTEETVNSISLEDCKNFYSTYFTPEIAYLTIVGDISVKEAKKLAKKQFSAWENKPIQLPTFDAASQPDKTKVALVDRSNSVQSEIRISYPIELKKGSPDVIKLNLLNTMLGSSGLTSRLNQNLREKHAYTYGAGSSISSDMIVGNFNLYVSVRNEVTDSAINQALFELQRMIDEQVTNEELDNAKAYTTGSFARAMENPQTIANFALNIKRYSLPEDYYATYLQKLNAVTIEDIQAMAKKYIKPDNAHIIVVGKASDVAEGLKQFGDVTYYNIYGNSYVPAKAELPAGLTAAKVLDDYISAIGGADKIRAIQDMKMVMKAELQGRELQITSMSKVPNKSKTDVSMGGMAVMTSVFNGTDASMMQMGQPMPIDDNRKKDMEYEAAIISELAIKDMELNAELTGIESIEGKNAYAVEITKPSGSKTTYYYDADSGLKVRTSETVQGPQGEMVQETDLLEYKEVDGVKFPFTITLPMGPMKMTATAESIEVNTGIDDSEFAVE